MTELMSLHQMLSAVCNQAIEGNRFNQRVKAKSWKVLRILSIKQSTTTFKREMLKAFSASFKRESYTWHGCHYMSPPLTIAASFHLAHPVEGIRDQVGESPIKVHGGQTALVPIPGCNQLGQIAVHILYHATDVQLPCKTQTDKETSCENQRLFYSFFFFDEMF